MTAVHERKKLPDTRHSLTHKLTIFDERGGETDVYLTLGFYEDGTIGELFLQVGKQGSTLKGAFDSFARMASIGLQYGVPVEDSCRKFRHVAFEPSGKTSNEKIQTCASIIDYLSQWIELEQSAEKGELP
jgi:ribonucleoside-diphosphate reductase alpha chain